MSLLATAPAAVPETTSVQRTAAAAVATAQATTADATYELTAHDSPSKPLRWLACRPIEFRINTSGMPKGMAAVVRDSMSSIGKQTGVRFQYAGHTERTFASTKRPARPTVYFTFTSKRSAYGRTFAYPGEIGVGGPTGAWYRDGDGELYEAITSGRVLLSTTFPGKRHGSGATWQSLIVHEVGHALNLAHHGSARTAMHPTLSSRSPGRFQPAELTTLKRVLQRSGCDYRAWSRL